MDTGLLGADVSQSARKDYDKISGGLTRWETMKASYKLSDMGTANYLLQEKDEDDFKNDTLVSADELNKMYPNLQVPFQGAVGAKLADSINNRSERRRLLTGLIGTGDRDVTQTLLNFVAAVPAHGLDRYEYAASILGTAALAVAFPGAAAMSILGRAAMSFTGAAIGNAIIEPYLAYKTQQSQEIYSASDAAMSVFGSAMVGTAIHMGGIGGRSLYSKLKRGRLGKSFQDAVAQAELGKKIVEAPELRYELSPSKMGELKSPPIPRTMDIPKFKGLGNTASFEKKFYSRSNFQAEADITRNVSKDGIFSNSIILNDDYRMSVNEMGGKAGSIYGVKLSADSKILPIETKLNSLEAGEFKVKFKDALEEKLGIKADENMSPKEIFDNATIKNKPQIESIIKEVSEETGFDGVTYKNKGAEEVALFKGDKALSESQTFIETKDFITNKDEIDAFKAEMERPESDQFYNAQEAESFKQRTPEMDEKIETHEEVLKKVDDEFKFAEDSVEAKDIQTMKSNIELMDDIFKNAEICLR